LASPPQPSFQHAFTHEVCARPTLRAGYSPENGGHVPLIDFCSWNDSRAQPRTIRPRRFVAMASHRAESCAALARQPKPNIASQGLCPLTWRRPTPTRRPHAVRGFTPVCSIRTPLVAPLYPPNLEWVWPVTARMRPLIENFGTLVSPAEACESVRAAPRISSRKDQRATAPKVPSTQRTPPGREQAHCWDRWCSGLGWSPIARPRQLRHLFNLRPTSPLTR
jgi:hypothetical protein